MKIISQYLLNLLTNIFILAGQIFAPHDKTASWKDSKSNLFEPGKFSHECDASRVPNEQRVHVKDSPRNIAYLQLSVIVDSTTTSSDAVI